MLKVTAYPASYGDCLLIEYGDSVAPSIVLIDGGTGISRPLEEKLVELKEKRREIELAVVTHIDGDHIAGMVSLLKKKFFGVPVRDFWFNGLRHLPGEAFSEKQGEQLTEQLIGQGLNWNDAVNGQPISLESAPQPLSLPGGAVIQLLSPDRGQLKLLRKDWISVCEAAGLYADPLAEFIVQEEREAFGAVPHLDVDALADEPFIEDATKANGSSIAFIFSYGDIRIFFGADAHPSRLLNSLRDLEGAPPYEFDLVKLPHHGSKANVSIELIDSLKSPRYLFSTNGKIHGHPSPQAVARTVRHGRGAELIFNYKTSITEAWDDPLLTLQYGYRVQFGVEGSWTETLSRP